MRQYGAKDIAHLPSSGSTYHVSVSRPASAPWPWVSQWDEDEGVGTSCASSHISETHNATTQLVQWDIGKPSEAPHAVEDA